MQMGSKSGYYRRRDMNSLSKDLVHVTKQEIVVNNFMTRIKRSVIFQRLCRWVEILHHQFDPPFSHHIEFPI